MHGRHKPGTAEPVLCEHEAAGVGAARSFGLLELGIKGKVIDVLMAVDACKILFADVKI